MADGINWDSLAEQVTANFATTGQWFLGSETLPDPVDWSALADQVQRNFAATGQWFLAETPLPTPMRLYIFSASEPGSGVEPWVTDGTPEGTRRIADINPGPGSSSPSNFVALGDGRLVFTAVDPTSGNDLWVTDGTPEGTQPVMDVGPEPGRNATSSASASNLIGLGDGRALFTLLETAFTSHGVSSSSELWVTDGTTAGTQMLTVTIPGFGNLPSFGALGDGRAVFGVSAPSTGIEPWVTDGTPKGTRLLADINPGPEGSAGFPTRDGPLPFSFTALGGGRVLFTASGPSVGIEPWVTDGTPEGTRLLADINPGTGASFPSDSVSLGNGRALFVAFQPGVGRELWVTDGTSAGTKLVAEINPGTTSGPFGLVPFGKGRVLFTASTPDTGTEPWVTDGTAEGTRLLADITPGPRGSTIDLSPGGAPPRGTTPFAFIPLTDELAGFTVFAGDRGFQSWITNGTPGGTRQMTAADLGPLAAAFNFNTELGLLRGSLNFARLNDGRTLFEPAGGSGLWITDGTDEGTELLADIDLGIEGLRHRHGVAALLPDSDLPSSDLFT